MGPFLCPHSVCDCKSKLPGLCFSGCEGEVCYTGSSVLSRWRQYAGVAAPLLSGLVSWQVLHFCNMRSWVSVCVCGQPFLPCVGVAHPCPLSLSLALCVCVCVCCVSLALCVCVTPLFSLSLSLSLCVCVCV